MCSSAYILTSLQPLIEVIQKPCTCMCTLYHPYCNLRKIRVTKFHKIFLWIWNKIQKNSHVHCNSQLSKICHELNEKPSCKLNTN